jgi:hypothetical protein
LVSKNQIKDPTLKEVETAINGIKKGKAADIFGLTVKNFIYGGNELTSFIHSIIHKLYQFHNPLCSHNQTLDPFVG